MKIIRRKEIGVKNRDDGRTVCYYPALYIPPGTEQVGFITVDTPKGCLEAYHKHPVSTEVFYHLTPGKVEVNGEVYQLNAGDIIILEPGDEHKQIADQNIQIVALRIPFR